MEQWILDGRSLVRQRDPRKAEPNRDVLTALNGKRETASPTEPVVTTSLLLTTEWCRLSGDRVLFRFLTAPDAASITEEAWAPAVDLSGGLWAFLKRTDATTTDELLHPNPYATVVCDVRWFYRGELVDASPEFEFVAGAGTVPQALEEAVLHLSAGEEGTFLCDPAFAFREDGLARPSIVGATRIPRAAVVCLVVTLIRFRNPLTEAEKLDEAQQSKVAGNAAIARGDYTAAMACYRSGLDRLASGASRGPAPTAEQATTARQLKATLLHNLAVAVMGADSLSAAAAEQAASHCTRALAVDPSYAKARYRRALAYIQARQFDRAADDARYLQLHPDTTDDRDAATRLIMTIDAARRGTL